jgi:hypothetical protein
VINIASLLGAGWSRRGANTYHRPLANGHTLKIHGNEAGWFLSEYDGQFLLSTGMLSTMKGLLAAVRASE